MMRQADGHTHSNQALLCLLIISVSLEVDIAKLGNLQELDAAESIFADICDEIEKAEKFFPVPESAQAWLDASAAAAAVKGMILHVRA
jgi:hypothetical protein